MMSDPVLRAFWIFGYVMAIAFFAVIFWILASIEEHLKKLANKDGEKGLQQRVESLEKAVLGMWNTLNGRKGR